jgi:hypothetical protein
MKALTFLVLWASLVLADFNFISFADTRAYHSGGLSKGCSRASAWSPEFALCPGDMDPLDDNDQIIHNNLGSGFPWFCSVGNHETEASSDMTYCKTLGTRYVNSPGFSDFTYGPAICPNTTYSFVYTGPAGIKIQVVNLDGYTRNSTSYYAEMTLPLLVWFEGVLANSIADYIVVLAHPPVFPKNRHTGDSWNRNNTSMIDDLWQLMLDYKVSCYFAGHTHYNYYMAIDDYSNWSSQDNNWDPNRGCIQMDDGALRNDDANSNSAILVKVDVKADKMTYTVYKVGSSSLSLKATFDQNKKRLPVQSLPVMVSGQEAGMELFPNPVNSKVQIKIKGIDYSGSGHLGLYNMTGRMIKKINFSRMEPTSQGLQYLLRTSRYANGIYTLKLEAGRHEINRTFVKLK